MTAFSVMMFIILGFLFTWEAWEGGSEAEFSMYILMWKSVEFTFVSLELGNEVNEVLWLLELLEVLSIDNVAELVLHLDHQLNQVQAVQSVLLEV